jgi:hypothetical protein
MSMSDLCKCGHVQSHHSGVQERGACHVHGATRRRDDGKMTSDHCPCRRYRPVAGALDLLKAIFVRDGKVICSSSDHDRGTPEQHAALIAAGYVEPSMFADLKTLRGPMGHRFSVAITAKGREVAVRG